MRGRLEASQLTRRAFVYVRQSSMAQVVHHHESTLMQYDLRRRALALGWAPEAIEVIDEDQARSGTTTGGRSGFARLAAAVAYGEAGGVFALDVSRLARSSEDWRRLLVLCGVAGVAVVDEQRIYDPNDQDDKLLLELKGTMSEAELHWLRLRLQGARQHKARRGALRMSAPTGYQWGDRGFEMDPDEACSGRCALSFKGTMSSRVRGPWCGGRARRGSSSRRDGARRTGTPGWSGNHWGSRACTKSSRTRSMPACTRMVAGERRRYWSTDRSAACVPTRAIRIGGW